MLKSEVLIVMDKRDIIKISMENIALIYNDVGEIAKSIEQRLSNGAGFSAYGDAAITWENSTAWYGNESWLYRWFARAYYMKETPRKAIGYCIHLGGYKTEEIERFQKFGIQLPALIMSSLDLKNDISNISRINLYDLLWDAGWNEKQTVDGKIAKATLVRDNVSVMSESLAVDLLGLKGKEDIEDAVIKPLTSLYYKKETDTSSSKILPIGTKGSEQ